MQEFVYGIIGGFVTFLILAILGSIIPESKASKMERKIDEMHMMLSWEKRKKDFGKKNYERDIGKID